MPGWVYFQARLILRLFLRRISLKIPSRSAESNNCHFYVLSPNVPEFETMCLPNFTHVTAWFNWLPNIIRGRPVSEVISRGFSRRRASVDVLSFFTHSTVELTIDCSDLYPIPGPTLASIFSSLTHLTMVIAEPKLQRVCIPLYYSSNDSISSKYVTGL
jgi:hypothetical protein